MLPDTSMDACRRVLEPFHDRLFTVASNAWDRYMLIPAEARVALARWKRARANAVWAFMMDAAQVLFENDPAVRSRLAFDTLTFEFCNTVLVRFKKMDAEGLSSNYPTARAESYNNSGQFEMFAEMWSAPI